MVKNNYIKMLEIYISNLKKENSTNTAANSVKNNS